MFEDTKAFSSFSVDDAAAAKDFYEGVLGLSVSEGAMPGILSLRLPGGAEVMAYEKPDHTPASYTVIHFPVPDLPATVADLAGRGVTFEHYRGTAVETDDDGIFRGGGPLIAWFTDPAGNVLAVLEEERDD